jgi:molybdate transport system permease protein
MIASLFLTLKLAFITTLILIPICLSLCVWLYGPLTPIKRLVLSFLTLPLVLPPTVLGFYLLIFMSPNGFIGSLVNNIGITSLVFTFKGLVIASIIYSIPFVLQPMYASLSLIDKGFYETSRVLGKSKIFSFYMVLVPMAKYGILTSAVLGFLHTIGEFGVILMIGGNIPGETGVASVYLYDLVESLNYDEAHQLSAILIITSLAFLYVLYSLSRLVSGKKHG